MGAETKLEFKNVTKRFRDGGAAALDGLSLCVGAGEFVVLTGPSGSGKTTALRAAAGLEEISSGQLLLDGADARRLAPRERGAAAVFQGETLYRRVSVYDNIAFPLTDRGLSRREAEAAVRDAARLLEIEELLTRRPDEISGGERRRAAIARALVCRPSLCLMDEAMSGLDEVLKRRVCRVLKGIAAETGAAFLYVTHDGLEAELLADRVVLMESGRAVREGTAAEIFGGCGQAW